MQILILEIINRERARKCNILFVIYVLQTAQAIPFTK